MALFSGSTHFELRMIKKKIMFGKSKDCFVRLHTKQFIGIKYIEVIPKS